MGLLKPTESLELFPFEDYARRRKYPRDIPAEFSSTNLTKRIPCKHQGHSNRGFIDEDNPCLVCGGRIRVLGRGDIFMCPFEDSRDQKTVHLKEFINIKFITASERYFIIQQEKKKNAGDYNE